MSRELRTTLAILTVVLILGAPLIFADAPTTQSTTSYLAVIFQATPPPPIETLIIQLNEMPSLYRRNLSEEVTNAVAATWYHDPTAAAAAFIAQGRETSWRAFYTSTLIDPIDDVELWSQVFRYQTPVGAGEGLAYSVAELKLDAPDFQEVTVNIPNSIALHRIFTEGDSATFEEYLIISQVGRYVTSTRMTTLAGKLPLNQALTYHQLGLNHLTSIPQVIQSSK